MPSPSFRFPGVLNSQELLVAEAIQARALASLRARGDLAGDDLEADKAKLGGIVLRLMSNRPQSIGDVSAAAVEAFMTAHVASSAIAGGPGRGAPSSEDDRSQQP